MEKTCQWGLHVWEVCHSEGRHQEWRTRGQKLQTSSGSTPDVISYNKGQCNERLAQACVGSSDRQAEACARGRLRQKKEEGASQH